MIDRLMHHAEILSLKGDNYRLRDQDVATRPRPALIDEGSSGPGRRAAPALAGRVAARRPQGGSVFNRRRWLTSIVVGKESSVSRLSAG